VRRGPRKGERPLTCGNTPKGLCANCAVTRWLKETPPLCDMLTDEGRWRIDGGPSAFLLPHVQRQFESLMRVGNCPVAPTEIDWPTIVVNWNKDEAGAETGEKTLDSAGAGE